MKKRADLRIEEIRILAEPAESGASCEVTLEERAGVDVRLATHPMSELGGEPVVKGVEPGMHDLVVVVATRITSDGPAGTRAAVVHRDDDRAGHSGKGKSRVPALVGPSRQIGHVTGVSEREPLIERARGLYGAQSRDTDEIEPQAKRLALEALLERALGGRAHAALPAHRA